MKYLMILMAFIMFGTVKACAQEDQEVLAVEAPAPIGGYSALQDSIEYPPILWKAGVETSFKADARISSTGKVLSVEFKPLLGASFARFDSLFFPEVSEKIQSARWRPAMVNGKAITCRVTIPFIFVEISNKKEIKRALNKGFAVHFFQLPIVISHPHPDVAH